MNATTTRGEPHGLRDKLTPHLRWMIRSDLPAVCEIEASFREPWERRGEEGFVATLRRRNAIGLVACDGEGGPVVGYCVFALHACEVRMEEVAVRKDRRRRWVGAAFVNGLLDKRTPTRPTLSVAVGERDLGTQLFLKACGLRTAITMPGEEGEDLYLFTHTLPGFEYTPCEEPASTYLERE